MRVVALGSGSSGNAVLVQAGRTTALVDAGFGIRALASRLRQVGVAPASLNVIALTHEHSDHTSGALAFARRHATPLLADARTLDALATQEQPSEPDAPSATPVTRVELAVGRETTVGDLTIRSFAVSHDAVAPCGYLLSSGAWHVVVATDTGEVTGPMLDAMRQAHLLVLEANHDRDRLVRGPYPWHLKQRILGPTGHLSNEQASVALTSALDDGPRWVWLAHLSRTNNTPALAHSFVRARLDAHGLRHVRLATAPPGLGPTWDSAALWLGGAARPVPTPADSAEAIPSAAPARLAHRLP